MPILRQGRKPGVLAMALPLGGGSQTPEVRCRSPISVFRPLCFAAATQGRRGHKPVKRQKEETGKNLPPPPLIPGHSALPDFLSPRCSSPLSRSNVASWKPGKSRARGVSQPVSAATDRTKPDRINPFGRKIFNRGFEILSDPIFLSSVARGMRRRRMSTRFVRRRPENTEVVGCETIPSRPFLLSTVLQVSSLSNLRPHCPYPQRQKEHPHTTQGHQNRPGRSRQDPPGQQRPQCRQGAIYERHLPVTPAGDDEALI